MDRKGWPGGWGERAGTEIKLVKRDSDRRVARVRMTHEVCFLAVIHAREQKKTNQRSHSCFYESTHSLFPFFLPLFCKHRSFIVLFFQPPLKQRLFQEIIPLYPSGHSARMSSQGYSSSAAWSVLQRTGQEVSPKHRRFQISHDPSHFFPQPIKTNSIVIPESMRLCHLNSCSQKALNFPTGLIRCNLSVLNYTPRAEESWAVEMEIICVWDFFAF